jgi:hypothetical protein
MSLGALPERIPFSGNRFASIFGSSVEKWDKMFADAIVTARP